MQAHASRVHQQYSTPLDGGVGFSSGAAVCFRALHPSPTSRSLSLTHGLFSTSGPFSMHRPFSACSPFSARGPLSACSLFSTHSPFLAHGLFSVRSLFLTRSPFPACSLFPACAHPRYKEHERRSYGRDRHEQQHRLYAVRILQHAAAHRAHHRSHTRGCHRSKVCPSISLRGLQTSAM